MKHIIAQYLLLLISMQNVFSESAPEKLNKCIIPNKLELQNLLFKLHPKNQTIEVGSFVENYEIIHMECENGYSLKGLPSLVCANGEWTSDFPTCVGYCDGSTLLSDLSLRGLCEDGNRFVECPKQISPGTEIVVNCAFGYRRTSSISQHLRCLPNGTFDNSPEPCRQNCGRIAPTSEVVPKAGVPIKSSFIPWHVAIYEISNNINNLICGGTIVSPSIILTAAHCFWDELEQRIKNHTDFEIVAGRSVSNYTDDAQNEYSQTVKVQEINIPIEYLGSNLRHKDDVAFLKLANPLKYSIAIGPICVTTNHPNRGAASYMASNVKGFINNLVSQNQLEMLKVITLSYHDCIEKSPENAPMAEDKFCVYSNEGRSACRGDSGGGFYTESLDPETSEIVYRLSGVISHTLFKNNNCTHTDGQTYVAITNILTTDLKFQSKLDNAIKEDQALF